MDVGIQDPVILLDSISLRHLLIIPNNLGRDGSFAIIIVSHRGCYIRHDAKFVDNPAFTTEQQTTTQNGLRRILEKFGAASAKSSHTSTYNEG